MTTNVEREEILYFNDVLKVDVSKRPLWWMNIVFDYEDNVLGGRDQPYPDDKVYQVQHLERYGFIVDPTSRYAIFPDPSDYINCMCKFSKDID